MRRSPGRSSGPLAAAVLLLGALACCQAREWKPFRPSNPDKDYHDISFVYDALREIRGNEAAAERIGRKLCKLLMGLNWFWVSTTMDTRFFSDSKLAWRVTCRRTGLPRNAVLMWFGTSPTCYGSCPAGWTTLSGRVSPRKTWFSCDDGSQTRDPACKGAVKNYSRLIYIGDKENKANFGEYCASGQGKVLCALAGRPKSAACSYTWRGTAPDCRDACEIGETLVAKDWYGEGERCSSGTYNKMLCERCQQQILDLNACTGSAWYGTAPACSGECFEQDTVVWRATSKDDVPPEHDPDSFGAGCWGGWKVRCRQCAVKSFLGSAPGGGLNGTSLAKTSCTAPKNGMVWKGNAVAAFSGIKTYADCCRECRDAGECRRFHVGPGGCFLFPGAPNEVLAPARHGRSGGGAWQAGSKQA